MRTDDHSALLYDAPREAPPADVRESHVAESPSARLRRIVDSHYDTVWRTVRFLGVPELHAEDVVQRAYCVAAQRLDEIAAGAERSFLLSTAWRMASEHRRSERRRPAAREHEIDALEASLPSPEQLLDQKRAHTLLHEVLAEMPIDLRMVFVLFEIEEMTVPEIAALVGVPLGTATSRLRRAREEFQGIVKRRTAASPRARGGGK